MAHTRPGVFKGQVRGVSHQAQEKTLHLKAGYIDADFPSFETFPLHSHGGPYIPASSIELAARRTSREVAIKLSMSSAPIQPISSSSPNEDLGVATTPGNPSSKTAYGVLEPGVADLNSSLKVLTVCVQLPEGEY